MTSTYTKASVLDRRSTKVMITAVFTALALATNYALIGIPNVKIMDTLVFIAALFFGLRLGIGVAVSVWLVYGFVNPNGVDTFLMLSFLMIGECFYALAGAALKKSFVAQNLVKGTKEYQRLSIVFGLVGLLTTFAYDALTNFGSWIFRTGSLYQDFVFGNIIGAPFSVAHEASNVVFFATIAPAIVVAATRLGLRTPQDVS
jgi:hypothetical protein